MTMNNGDMSDLLLQRQLQEDLNYNIKQLKNNGIKLAEAEMNYKIALNKKALELRSMENMPVTLINQVIYGVPEIARLRFKRDVAQATYIANQEAINSIKLQLRLNDNQIGREWNG